MNKLKDMPKNQRPGERFMEYGVASLTDAELICLVLRTGSRQNDILGLSNDILEMTGPKHGLANLMHKKYEELLCIKGVGKIKAMQLICIGEIVKRIWKRDISQKVYFTSPQLCATYYMQDMRYLEQEELRMAFLDTKQKLLSDCTLTVGTVDASLVSVREILIEALKRQAVNVILIHNHPSGNSGPSEEDIRVTKKIAAGFAAIGITLNDHIIIGDNNYYSFRENGGL